MLGEICIDDIQWDHVSDTDGPRSLPPVGQRRGTWLHTLFQALDASRIKLQSLTPDPFPGFASISNALFFFSSSSDF